MSEFEQNKDWIEAVKMRDHGEFWSRVKHAREVLPVRRQTRMAECTNPTVENIMVEYNGEFVPLPNPFSWEAMKAANQNIDITELQIGGGFSKPLSGSKEAANELLDFSVDQIAEAGLQRLVFCFIEASVTELEVEILTVLAPKASQIR